LAIETNKLSKSYGRNRGVIELDLQIRPGEIFGFLGPNGAGKTTTIRLLMNLIRPSQGQATIYGLDSQRDSVEIKRFTGYLPGEFSLYPNLTGAQTLKRLVQNMIKSRALSGRPQRSIVNNLFLGKERSANYARL
jgi:ABC-2 type transport system ATP-binding protein